MTQTRVWKIVKTIALVGAVTVPPAGIWLATHTDERGLQVRVFDEPYADIVDRYIEKHPEWKKIDGVHYAKNNLLFWLASIGKLENMPYESVPIIREVKGKIADAGWPQHDGSFISLKKILAKNSSEKGEEGNEVNISLKLLPTLIHTAKSENVLSNDGVRTTRLVPDLAIERLEKSTSRSTFRVKGDTFDGYNISTRDAMLRKLASFQLPRASRANAVTWHIGEDAEETWAQEFRPLYEIYEYNSPEEFITGFKNGDITSNFEVGIAMGIIIHAYIEGRTHVTSSAQENAKDTIEQALIDPQQEELKRKNIGYSRKLQDVNYDKVRVGNITRQLRDELSARKRENTMLQSQIDVLKRTGPKAKKPAWRKLEREKIERKIAEKNASIRKNDQIIDQLRQKINNYVVKYQIFVESALDIVQNQREVVEDIQENQEKFYSIKESNYQRVKELLNNSNNFDRTAAFYPTGVMKTFHHTPQQSILNMALINQQISGKMLDRDILSVDGDIEVTGRKSSTEKLADDLSIDLLLFTRRYSEDDEKKVHAQHENVFQSWTKNLLGMRWSVREWLMRPNTWNNQVHSKVLFHSMTLNMDAYYVTYRTLRHFYKDRKDRKEDGRTMFDIVWDEFKQFINGDPEWFRNRLHHISSPTLLKKFLSQQEVDIFYSQLLPNLVVTQAIAKDIGPIPWIYTEGTGWGIEMNEDGESELIKPKNETNTQGRAVSSKLDVSIKR